MSQDDYRMDSTEFREALKRLGHTQSSFAREMVQLGDPRPFLTVLRSVSNWARGEFSVPGEVCVVLTLLTKVTAQLAPGPARPSRPVSRPSGPSRPSRVRNALADPCRPAQAL